MKRFTRRHFIRAAGPVAAGLSFRACQPFDTLLQMGRPVPSATPDPRLAPLEEQVQRDMDTFQIPGMAVGLIRDNRLFYAKGFGVRNLNTGEPMTGSSVMSMASISKAFTGAAIMQLVEAGKVDVDRPYVEYVPYFEMETPRYKQITVRHLLAHNSGILTPGDAFSIFADPWEDEGAAERLVRSLKTGAGLGEDPGAPQFLTVTMATTSSPTWSTTFRASSLRTMSGSTC